MLLGRTAELKQLRGWWDKALTGARQLGFISGEPGIGKTTLVNAFLDELAAGGECWLAGGHSVEFYGAGEAFMPLLEALEQLCQGTGGERVIACFDQFAPTWLLQLTGLPGSVDRADLPRRTQGASRKRLVYFLRAEYPTGRELAVQGLDVAQCAQDPALLVEAHRMMGAAWYWLGELLPARQHLEQSIALYDPPRHGALALLYGFDPKIHALGYRANALWLLGYPDQALHSIHEALALAHERSHPLSLAIALHFAAWLHHLRQERPAAQARAEALAALASEQGFPHWSALGVIWQGWVRADQGQVAEGMAQMRQGLAAYQGLSRLGWRCRIGSLGRPRRISTSACPQKDYGCWPRLSH
jgi:tetratricopeptide (TPR) repeat protein